VVAFTGKLACLSRRVAQAKVRELGGETADDVTKRTTMLVVGDEGFLSKIDTSRKLRTAERQIPRVQIVSETAFCRRAGRGYSTLTLNMQFLALFANNRPPQGRAAT
jgi:NAD-dependent DNA ligase